MDGIAIVTGLARHAEVGIARHGQPDDIANALDGGETKAL